ncbi:MAG: pyruvate kinase [Solirubrobacterales bacterium]|nr:pyruvate kinase [Solirubrobacterales bacterium]
MNERERQPEDDGGPDTQVFRIGDRMTEHTHRRTKIVATIGPSSRSPKILERLISAGADVFRLNFSHGDEASHAENIDRIRAAGELMGKWVGILGDLPGPKLRLGDISGGFTTIRSESSLTLTTDGGPGVEGVLPVGWAGLPAAVREGDPIYLADGRVRLRAVAVEEDEVHCRVEVGGRVASHQGVNLPGTTSGMPAVGASDLRWVDFAVDNDVDLLAMSFVRSASDLDPVHERLAERHSSIPLIAKIEKPQAAENAAEIIEAATSGIMVARGDLGIELPIESVPATQKRLISLAGERSKPVITATQMLASMVSSDRPTRAEVTDVANAIYDGTDAVMLSEETAIGDNPVEAVATMDRIARWTERDLPYAEWLIHRVDIAGEVSASVAQGAVASTYRLGLAAIVVPTMSGRTARLVSALRPEVPILAISQRRETVRRLNLLFGVRCAYTERWGELRDLLDDCASIARTEGIAKPGQLIAVTAGLPDQELGTNLFEIHRVPG